MHSIGVRASVFLLVAYINPCHGRASATESDLPSPQTYYAFSNLSTSQDGHYVLVSRANANYEWDLSNRAFVRGVPGRKASIQLGADGQHAFYPNARTGKIDILDLASGQVVETSVAVVSPDVHVGLAGEHHAGSRSDKPLINIYEVAADAQSTWKGDLPKSEGHEPLALSDHGDTLVTLQYYNHFDFVKTANAVMGVAGGILSFSSTGVPSFSSTPTLLGVPLKSVETANAAAGVANTASQSAGPFSYSDSRLVIWDVHHLRQVMTVNRLDIVFPTCLAMNSIGSLLIVNSRDESLDAFDLNTSKRRQLVKKPVPAIYSFWSTFAVAISPDSTKVLRTGSTQWPPTALSMTILDSSSGQLLLTIPVNSEPGFTSFPFRSWFSPDGRFVAMLNGLSMTDSIVRVWDVATGQLIFTRRATDAVLTSKGTVLVDDFREEVPVEHNLMSGADNKFAEIPESARLPILN